LYQNQTLKAVTMTTDKQNIYLRTAQKKPFNPFWRHTVALCTSKEELFEQVEPHGFINPDALNELTAQGLYNDYLNWKNEGERPKKQGNPVNNIFDKIVND